MRLVVQVPCLNKAPRLAGITGAIPRDIPGVDTVEVLVVDDGSTDGTDIVAREAGADHVVRFPHNRGLSVAFQTGLREALRAGADIVVGDRRSHGSPRVPVRATTLQVNRKRGTEPDAADSLSAFVRSKAIELRLT